MKKIIILIIILVWVASELEAQTTSARPITPKGKQEATAQEVLPFRGVRGSHLRQAFGDRRVSDGENQNPQGNILDSYLEMAAENNPGLQSKYKEFEAALQRIPQVNALPDPSFSFGYFISPVETRVGPQRAKFSLSQLFPWFGTLEAKSDAAALAAAAKYQSFLEARNKLYYDVSAAYYPLYELQQVQKIEQENIEILQSYKNIATRKFENGVAPMVDALRVDIMMKDAQTNLEILNEKEYVLVSTFNNLLNRDENEDVIVSDTLMATDIELEAVKDSMLMRNPTINALDLKTRASKASEVVAQKQGLPNIGVGLDYVIVGERSDMSVADAGKDVLMPMVSVSIPIFREKYRASVREAKLNQDRYTLQKEEVSNMLETGYEMTMFELEQQQELLALYRKQVQTSEQSLNLLFSAYGNSGKEFEEVLRMQQQLLKYEKLVAGAEAKYLVALARINYITAKNSKNEK